MLTRLRSLLLGVQLPLQAVRLILSHPRLILLSVLPIAVTLVVFVYFFRTAQGALELAALQQISAWGWSTEGWGISILVWFLRIFLLFAGGMLFSFFANLVAILFNDFLAESSEKWITPALSPAPKGTWGYGVRLLWMDLLKNLVAGLGLVLAALLSWVPVLNVFALGGTFLLISFQYISYAQSRRGVGVVEAFQFVWRHFFCCLGFGLVFSFLFFVPVVSIFVLPVAVVAGTLLVAEGQRSELK